MWRLIKRFKGGHKYFVKDENPVLVWTEIDKIYIADQSGSTPDKTDDGELWIDRDYPITPGRTEVCGDNNPRLHLVSGFLPLRDRDGKLCHAIISAEEVKWLMSKEVCKVNLNNLVF